MDNNQPTIEIINVDINNSDAWLNEIVAIETACNPTPWQIKHFQTALQAKNQLFLLRTDNKSVAYSICMLGFQEAHLLNIAVIKPYRRQGLAKLLLQHTISWANWQNCQQMFLEVRQSNTEAIALYNKFGFTKIGVRKNYYSNNGQREDANVMALEMYNYKLIE